MEAQEGDPVEFRGVVERAAPDDWIAIAHLNVWAFREFAVELGQREWPELVRVLTGVGPAAREGPLFVVRSELEPVGSAAYRPPGRSRAPIPPDWASVELLAVAPPDRGKGLGAALVHVCEAQAMEDGAEFLAAVVPDYQRAAQELFARLGFHREQGLARPGQRPYALYRKRPLFG
ncbi:MAG TPA: GNAT family N-acetyltransferase [Actinomycetota bacterium]|nr:GNAT family N-acetyltransferase [Actinomycetota bacterium]